MTSNELPDVDVIIPLRNEAHRITEFMTMLLAQTHQPRRIIIADGMSDDGSRDKIASYQATDARIMLVDNTDRIVPAALNKALSAVSADIVARMDTHAVYEPTYLESVVKCLADRPDVAGVGGAMATAGRGSWGRAIASTLSRPWGLGGARHRVGGEAGPIPHIFSGCYRTEALESISGWDERFRANEDFEADTRLHEAGLMLWLEPSARSTWFVRESPRGLAVQMWWYGFCKAATLRLHPSSLQPRQLVPPALVLSSAALLTARPRVGVAFLTAYAAASGMLGARAARTDGASPLRGAAVPAIVHFSWGTGLLAGSLAELLRPTRARVNEEWNA